MCAFSSAYADRIAGLFNELGIPSNYGQERQLSLQEEAMELVSIGPDENGRDCRLGAEAARAWALMREQARISNVYLLPLSGFRSVDRQAEIIRGKLTAKQPIVEILRSLAAPGYSEHHTGQAIDIGSPGGLPLVEAFAETNAFNWLVQHGSEFGFHLSFPRDNPHGIVYEPWHWCWQA